MSSATNGDGLGRSNGFGMFQAPSTLTGVQRLGIDTAAEVINGFIDLPGAESAPQSADPDSDPSIEQEPGFAQLRINVARALDLYTELIQRSFDSYADLMEQRLRAGGVHLNATDNGLMGLLTLHCAADGIRAAGTVWMHNTTDQPVSAVLRLTDLTAHDGKVVPSCAGCFEPTAVTIGPVSSVSARLTILLGDIPPGVYQGHVLANGLPEAALPVRLVVTDVAPGSLS